MTAKEYLRHIRSLNGRINAVTDDIAELEARLTSVGSPALKADIVSENGSHDRMAEGIAKLADLCAEWDGKVDEWEALAKDAGKRIDGMKDGDYARLLRLYYLSGKTWEQVAVAMNYSWRHAHRLHGKALLAFEKENPDIF